MVLEVGLEVLEVVLEVLEVVLEALKAVSTGWFTSLALSRFPEELHR